MSGTPVCPYCNESLEESIPSMIQGTIQLRCPACSRIYGYSKDFGAFPIEEQLDYHFSAGPFRKVRVGVHDSFDKNKETTKLRLFIFLCLLSPIIILFFFMILSLLVSSSIR